jgi:hypothetical protein
VSYPVIKCRKAINLCTYNVSKNVAPVYPCHGKLLEDWWCRKEEDKLGRQLVKK